LQLCISQHGPILTRRRFVYPLFYTENTLNIYLTELINIHSAFHAGAFQQVLDFDTSSFSSANAVPARILKYRSKIALGQSKEVAAELSSEKTPDLVAVKLLAEYENGKDVVETAKKLAAQHGQENLAVQLCVGIVLDRAGETEAALELLSKHQGSLDAYVGPEDTKWKWRTHVDI
jgi:coatomer protein complex subunit epsilon